MLKDSEIVQLVTPKLRDVLGNFGFRDATAKSGFDHDGDPVVFMEVHYGEAAPELDPQASIDATIKAMAEMRQHGDERFVHMNHIYPDEDPAPDDDEDGAGTNP